VLSDVPGGGRHPHGSIGSSVVSVLSALRAILPDRAAPSTTTGPNLARRGLSRSFFRFAPPEPKGMVLWSPPNDAGFLGKRGGWFRQSSHTSGRRLQPRAGKPLRLDVDAATSPAHIHG
jgi:hypothetical protein